MHKVFFSVSPLNWELFLSRPSGNLKVIMANFQEYIRYLVVLMRQIWLNRIEHLPTLLHIFVLHENGSANILKRSTNLWWEADDGRTSSLWTTHLHFSAILKIRPRHKRSTSHLWQRNHVSLVQTQQLYRKAAEKFNAHEHVHKWSFNSERCLAFHATLKAFHVDSSLRRMMTDLKED